MKYLSLMVMALMITGTPVLADEGRGATPDLRIDKPKPHRSKTTGRKTAGQPWDQMDWNPDAGAKPRSSFGPAHSACAGCKLGVGFERNNNLLPRNGINPFD